MKKTYTIKTKSGKEITLTWHNDPVILMAKLAELNGAKVVTIHARHDLVAGKDVKKTNPIEGEKRFGYNGLTNVSYKNAVRNFLRKHGETLLKSTEAKIRKMGKFLVAESKIWEPKKRVWGEHKDGLRHVIGHTNKDGESKVYITLLTWYKEGSLYHEYLDTDGNVMSEDDIAPHLYAKSYSKPTVKLSNGDKIEVPFYVRTITIDKVVNVKGIDIGGTNLGELADMVS